MGLGGKMRGLLLFVKEFGFLLFGFLAMFVVILFAQFIHTDNSLYGKLQF